MNDLEAKFFNWEIERELERLKKETPLSYSQNFQQKNTQQSKSRYNPPKNIRCYEILGLKPGASLKEVKQAYRRLVKKWHPDLFFQHPQMQRKAQEKLRQINEAYKELSSSC